MPGAHGTVLRERERFEFWTKPLEQGPSVLEVFAGREVARVESV